MKKLGKKHFLYIVFSSLIFLLNINVFAKDDISFCNSETIFAFKLIGNMIIVLKIIVPLAIIIFGMIDFGRAVISTDEKALKVSTMSLIRRAVSGIIIFLVPTLVSAIMKIAIEDPIANKSFDLACTKCMFNVSSCDKLAKGLPDVSHSSSK